MLATHLLRTTAVTAALLSFATMATAQTSEETAPAEETPAEVVSNYDATTVVARVGTTEITLGHVTLMASMLPEQYAQLPDEALFEGIVEQLIDQILLSEEAGEPASWSPQLQLRIENERRAVLARSSLEAVAEKPIEEREIQAAYNEAIGKIPAEKEFNASHILVETEEKALELMESLRAGGDFAETAKVESTGPSGPNGGSLGWFPAGAMVPEFDEVVTTMEPGAISDPVQTQFGWHVITLNETRDKPKPSLEETRGEFENQIRQQKVQEHIAALREAGDVENLSEDIPASAVRDTSIFAE